MNNGSLNLVFICIIIIQQADEYLPFIEKSTFNKIIEFETSLGN